MGHKRHHTIAVASFQECRLRTAHQEAAKLFGTVVSSIIVRVSNSDWSAFLAPKDDDEGWSDGDDYDEARRMFKLWLRSAEGNSRPSFFDWVEIDYENGIGSCRISDHSSISNLTLDSLAVLAAALRCPVERLLSDLCANGALTNPRCSADSKRQKEVLLL